MYAMGNKTKTRNFDNDFLSHSNCENIESVIGVNSSRSYIVPPEVLKRRQKFWEHFFFKYSDQFSDDTELDVTTLKPCKSECRPQITHKPRSVVQHWVNTGYLPYQISIKKVDYIKGIDPDTGKPNINYMKPCYDGSSLSSSVDTATYILQNINTTNKEKRMAIMGEAKPHSSTSFCDTSHYENTEVTQIVNDKIHECNAKNNISNNNDTNNHPRCLITSDILLPPLQQKNIDLKENIIMLNKVVNTNGPLFDNSKSNSCELLNKSCESLGNKIYEQPNVESHELPNNESHELPNNESCELSSNESCELLSNKSCELLNNKSCELQNNKSCELQNNKSCELQNNKSCELLNNKSCELSNNGSCELLSNKSCELPNNKSCELQNNKSCEIPNNRSYETPNNKSCELQNDTSCELSKIQSTSMYSKRSYLEKSLLNSDVTKIRHRKKLYTGRNSPVDLVTMKNCNKQVLCKLQQHIHPALDFGYSLPNKLNIKRRRKMKQSCIISKNLTNVSQVISSYKRTVQSENVQNYFDLLHMTLANQSITTNDKDDDKNNELNNTTVKIEKIRSKTHKKSNNTFAQSKNLKLIGQSTKLSRNSSRKCTKKSNKHMDNLKNLNPTVLLTKLSNLDIQKYKKLNNFLYNLNPVIRLRRLAKFDIQKYKKPTNIMKNTKYLNAIVRLEKLSDTVIKRYKTTLNMKKHNETNLLSDTFQLSYSENKCQPLLSNTVNCLQSPLNVIKITSNDTDSDQSTVLMYRCNSKTSDTLSTSNVSVFSKNAYKFYSPLVQACINADLKTDEVNETSTFKDVQSKENTDNTVHIFTNSQNNLCSTLSHKSEIIPKNNNNNDNAHTISDKELKLSSTVETSDNDDVFIKPRYCLRSRNSQDNLCSALSPKSEIIPKNNNDDNAHTTNDKKIKISSTVETPDSDDELIKPRHYLRSRNSQDNVCNTLSHNSEIIPKNNNNNDNAHTSNDKMMKLNSTIETFESDDELIKPRHYLRSRNSQNNVRNTRSHKSEIIPKNNNNNDNAHTSNDKMMKLNSTIETFESDDELIKPKHYLRSRNSQDNVCNTLSHKSEIIPKNNNNNDNAHTSNDKMMKLNSTIETSDSDDELIKPRHYLRSRNSQDNLCSALSPKSEIIPKNNNDDNAHTTNDKNMKLSSVVQTSNKGDTPIKPRHCLRPRNLQNNLCSTLSRKSKIIPNDNNNDNEHRTSDKKMKLSSTVETSDTADALIKPRHCLRSRNSQNNLRSTLSRKSKVVPNNNNNNDDYNANRTSDKMMNLGFTVETSDIGDTLIKPRHCLRSRKTLNLTNEQDSNEFNNLNITKPCKESGRIKSRVEDVIKTPIEILQRNTKFRKDNKYDINYIHFETNLFDLNSDSDFTSSTFSP